MKSIDLFRVNMSPAAGPAVAELYTPDENGRIYCGQGKHTDAFEDNFAWRTALSHAPLGVNSCSAAIDLALHMIGVGPGDEVICSPLTCTASNGPVVTRGASIVWADINAVTGLIEANSVEGKITPKTKAIIAVDWAGRYCNYANLRAASGYRVPIIEDAAHCLYTPAERGDYIAWSFGPIKHLTTGGYGGALLTPGWQRKRAELLRWHGLDRNGPTDSFRCAQDIQEVGYRYHMTDDQAVVGLANLQVAQKAVAKSRENAAWYYEQLKHVNDITVPPFDPTCNYWLFGLLIHEDRDGFIERMAKHGVATGRVHARNDKHTAFQSATVNPTPLPGVDYFDSHQVNIPVGWWISPLDREYIVKAIGKSLKADATLVAA